MTAYVWEGNYGITLRLTLDQAESCTHPGPCDLDVAWLAQQDAVAEQTGAWNAETLAKELRGYGAWSREELDDHAQNILRMIWIICGDIADRPEDYEEA